MKIKPRKKPRCCGGDDVGWKHDGGGGGGDVFRVSEALEEAPRMVGGVVLGQKSETFFFRSFLFQTERRPKSSADIPNTLRNSD